MHREFVETMMEELTADLEETTCVSCDEPMLGPRDDPAPTCGRCKWLAQFDD